jgi:hypothetical protein
MECQPHVVKVLSAAVHHLEGAPQGDLATIIVLLERSDLLLHRLGRLYTLLCLGLFVVNIVCHLMQEVGINGLVLLPGVVDGTQEVPCLLACALGALNRGAKGLDELLERR